MSISDAIIEPAEQLVRIRRTNVINGEQDGWVLDPHLRCQDVTIRAGLGLGRATFAYVSTDMTPPAIEDIVNRYHPDDQVRVELFPPDNAMGLDTPAEATGLVVFEGTLTRQPMNLVSQNEKETERADFVATAMPFLDQWALAHLVTARWYHMPLSDPPPDPRPHWSFVESRDVPPVFNYRGRPNMDNDDGHIRHAQGRYGFSARPFTHDDNPAGAYWTVGEAIRSLLVEWVYGSGLPARNRVVAIEKETDLALMSDESPTNPRWVGLDQVLPETDVTGMGVFQALNAVCLAAGFEWVVEPDMQLADEDADRLYLIRIWRRHAGPAIDLHLPKRGQFPADPAEILRRADINRIRIVRDNAGIINDVVARGRVQIEASVVLKPLWSPDDMDDATVTDTHQLPPGQASDTYHNKHVQGGSSFADYGHVGRLWGIDCTGANANGFYPSGDYKHDADGYDWLDALGIDGSDPLNDERDDRGITNEIEWMRRIRRPQPLTRPDMKRTGRRYILEVSENGGTSWTDVSGLITFTTLNEFFGIQLNSLPNLAAVNAESLATGVPPAVADSWWQKMIDGDGSFRLTANIPADHESLFIIASDGTSGTAYSRGELIDVDTLEVWCAPEGALNTGSTWVKQSSSDADAVEGAALRYLDAHEGTRLEVSCDSFLLRPWRWRVGSRVRSIAGRGVSLATRQGNEDRHPVIVESRMVLAGPNGEGSAQGVYLSLTDTAVRGGA